MNAYVERVYEGLKARNAHESEFLQAAYEILNSLSPVFDKHPEYEKAGLLDRFVEPERTVMFRVPWACRWVGAGRRSLPLLPPLDPPPQCTDCRGACCPISHGQGGVCDRWLAHDNYRSWRDRKSVV